MSWTSGARARRRGRAPGCEVPSSTAFVHRPCPQVGVVGAAPAPRGPHLRRSTLERCGVARGVPSGAAAPEVADPVEARDPADRASARVRPHRARRGRGDGPTRGRGVSRPARRPQISSTGLWVTWGFRGSSCGRACGRRIHPKIPLHTPCTAPAAGLETCVPVLRRSGRRSPDEGGRLPSPRDTVDRRTTGRPVPRCGLWVTTQVPVRGRKTTRVRLFVENGFCRGDDAPGLDGTRRAAGVVTSPRRPWSPGPSIRGTRFSPRPPGRPGGPRHLSVCRRRVRRPTLAP